MRAVPLGGRHRLRIGLFGGSFNPAHDGHRHISLTALKALRLDAVWWLVSPQNPLKKTDGMAPLPARLDAARRIADHPRLVVTDIETRLDTRFTLDTVRALRRRFPDTQFVLLIGADNLAQLHRWRGWRALARAVPIAVFDRPGYAGRALSSRAAHVLRRFRRREAGALSARPAPLPAWVFVHARLHPASATEIRQRQGWREPA